MMALPMPAAPYWCPADCRSRVACQEFVLINVPIPTAPQPDAVLHRAEDHTPPREGWTCQLSHRAAMARDDNPLPRLHCPNQLGQSVLGLRNTDGHNHSMARNYGHVNASSPSFVRGGTTRTRPQSFGRDSTAEFA